MSGPGNPQHYRALISRPRRSMAIAFRIRPRGHLSVPRVLQARLVGRLTDSAESARPRSTIYGVGVELHLRMQSLAKFTNQTVLSPSRSDTCGHPTLEMRSIPRVRTRPSTRRVDTPRT